MKNVNDCKNLFELVEEREYNGYNVTIAEDNQFFYIDFNTGLGEGVYDKSDWTLEKALENQANIQ